MADNFLERQYAAYEQRKKDLAKPQKKSSVQFYTRPGKKSEVTALTAWLMLALLTLVGCQSKPKEQPQLFLVPQFESFSYVGNDARYNVTFDAATQYLNPIISGCNPDPSITRKGKDFFMANSSFAAFPGIPVWHSVDLIHWELVGHALDRPSQLDLPSGLRIDGGIYAPDIKYNPFNDTFYLIVTNVDGTGNFIVKTQDPFQGWSEPIPVPEVGGIDPSFLFDTNGKAYIVNNDAPAYEAQYDGHRAIWIREFDTKTDRVVGKATVLVDKGIRPQDKPIWIEGPHLYHIGNRYYLMAAEGGTSEGHSEVILSSSSPKGPFVPCPVNPILTQREMAHDRLNPVTCTGHADLIRIDDEGDLYAEGKWWAVFLGCTPYEGDEYYNTGRSSFLLPVSWQKIYNDEATSFTMQPVILKAGEPVPMVCQRPALACADSAALASPSLLTGNVRYTDNFEGDKLDAQWFTLRTPHESWWQLSGNGSLLIKPRPVNIAEPGQPSMLCRYVKNNTFKAETVLNFTPQNDSLVAGISYYQSERCNLLLCKSCTPDGEPFVCLIRNDKDEQTIVGISRLEPDDYYKPLTLRVEADGSRVLFGYQVEGKHYVSVGGPQNGRLLSTTYAGGFTGALLGLYSFSLEE